MSGESPAAVLFDAFGQEVSVDPMRVLRVASPFTLGDFVHKYRICQLDWYTLTATGGTVTHVPDESAARLEVTASSGSRALLQTHEFFRYQAGKPAYHRFTLYHSNAGTANQKRRWGQFDADDGLFFELNGTSLRLVRRTSVSGSVVEVAIERANWNGDKLDGTGPSGITLDLTKLNLYEIDYAWLGALEARFRINNILVHRDVFANALASPYMKTAVLPLAFEVINTGAAAIASMTQVCASSIVSGGAKDPSWSFGAFNPSDISVSATELGLIAIRLKATFSSIANRMLVFPTRVAIKNEGARAAVRVVSDPAITGGSWVSAGSDSGVEYNVSMTGFSGGQHIDRSFLPATSNEKGDVDLRQFFGYGSRKLRLLGDGTSNVLLITGQNEATGTTLMRASVAWDEVR